MKTKSPLLVVAAILFTLSARTQAQTPSQNEKATTINVLIEQANSAMNAKRWEDAISPLQELLALDPTNWQYYAALGDAQVNLWEYAEAVESYEKGIHAAETNTAVDSKKPSTDPTKRKAAIAKMLANQASAYAYLHKNEEAFTVAMKAAALDPNPAAAYFNLCATAYNVNNMAGAHAACDKAIAADPSKADAYFINGTSLFMGSETDKNGKLQVPAGTVEALKKYLELAPTGAHAAEVKQILAEVGAEVAAGPASRTSKDSAESEAYSAALNTSDPEKRAAAMESFVRQYPQSVVLMDALEKTMNAYEQSGNWNKVVDTATQILVMDPFHNRALSVITNVLDRRGLFLGQEGKTYGCAEAEASVKQVPSWPKPEDLSDSEFERMRYWMAAIFNRMKGNCALSTLDYPTAREAYTKAFQIDRTNSLIAFSLARTDLEMNPVDLNGIWYCGKAMTLAKDINLARTMNHSDAWQMMGAYCRPKYRQYHGGDDGFYQMIAGTATENTPPPDFPSRITRDRTQPALKQQSSPSQ